MDTIIGTSFKPYYKWIIFNIKITKTDKMVQNSFKPYYKWIIFNIEDKGMITLQETQF